MQEGSPDIRISGMMLRVIQELLRGLLLPAVHHHHYKHIDKRPRQVPPLTLIKLRLRLSSILRLLVDIKLESENNSKE